MVDLSKMQKTAILKEAKCHRWVSSGGPRLTVTCSCGVSVDNVADRGIGLLCPQANRLLVIFDLKEEFYAR